MSTSKIRLLLALELLTNSLWAHGPISPQDLPQGLRWIETSPGSRLLTTPQERAWISEKAHAEGKCGGYMDLTGAQDPSTFPALKPSLLSLAERPLTQGAMIELAYREVDEGKLLGRVLELSTFPTRHYRSPSGLQAVQWLQRELQTLSAHRTDVDIGLFRHADFPQPSVIATIRGDGPLSNEHVVLGGHLDSISSGSRAPGADDNASGTSTLMEAFRILVQMGFRPARTVHFMGYAAEEVGLLGSREIAEKFRREETTVVGTLQLDMTMFPGGSPKISFITDFVDADLTRFTQRLVDSHVRAPWVEGKCGYACSDHASWNRVGYASAFPFEAPPGKRNQKIHTPRDTHDRLSASHGVTFLKLALAFAIELGLE